MEAAYPAYYTKFRCIAGECGHSCCIGWEIDIDEDTMALYRETEGAMGERLHRCISAGETPSFILGEGERCPFLNERNLCDIILEKGEGFLCQICREHPRFHNVYPGRVESGLGLCCEAAGRLILGREEPAQLCITGEWEAEDELLALRDDVIAVLQLRELPLAVRAERALALCGAVLPGGTVGQWAQELLRLERLEESWTVVQEALAADETEAVPEGTAYEQLMVYFIYRHLANARDEVDLAARSAFAVLGARIVYAADRFLRCGAEAYPVEAARQFSAEIEYSEENMETVLNLLAKPWPMGACPEE